MNANSKENNRQFWKEVHNCTKEMSTRSKRLLNKAGRVVETEDEAGHGWRECVIELTGK